MFSLARLTSTVAAIGGLLWTVKAVVITARDGSFDPLESFVFIGGLLALLAASVLAAMLVTARFRGAARAAAAAGAAVGLVAVTLALTEVGQVLVASVAPGGNLGLEEEGGILLAGLTWLFVAGRISLSGRARRRPAAGPLAA
jgi:hypothetical protein